MSLTKKQAILVITGYVLCVISTLAVIFRCIARRIIRSYSWDDLLMVIGQVSGRDSVSSSYYGLTLQGLVHGNVYR